MIKFNDVIVLIPAYLPDEKMVSFVKDLLKKGFNKIVIVRDGVFVENEEIFQQINDFKECFVIDNNVNLGKGRALKAGFNYILNNFKDIAGVVMADADGQHLASDVVNMAKALKANINAYILGVRNFFEAGIPMRSVVGNRIAGFFFSYLIGDLLEDTQTGLRAVSYENLKKFIKIDGEKYDFETNMLLNLKKLGINIVKVKIQTVYIDDNKSSHFNPWFDSLKIAYNIIKYYMPLLLILVMDNLGVILFYELSFKSDLVYIYGSAIGTLLLNIKFNSGIYKYQNNNNVYFLLALWWILFAFIMNIMYDFFNNLLLLKVVGNFIFFLLNIAVHNFLLFKMKK